MFVAFVEFQGNTAGRGYAMGRGTFMVHGTYTGTDVFAAGTLLFARGMGTELFRGGG
jgi:hypothetical protein